jgi:hypothetical protein
MVSVGVLGQLDNRRTLHFLLGEVPQVSSGHDGLPSPENHSQEGSSAALVKLTHHVIEKEKWLGTLLEKTLPLSEH